MFIRICGAIIELDVQSLPFRRELWFHDFVSEGMSLQVIVLLNDMNKFSMMSRLLEYMALKERGCELFKKGF